MESHLDTMNLLKNLTPDQSARYAAFEELFDSKGWKYIMEWAKGQETYARNAAAHANSWDENRICVGREETYKQFVNLSKGILAEFEVIADAKANADEEDEGSMDIASQS